MTLAFKCLAVDTATERCSIAACGGSKIGRHDFVNSRTGSRLIFGVVAEVLDEAGVELGDLDCFALGCGPGGFTGLRLGAAAIQSLAYGTGKPVCCISSLAAIAAGGFREHGASLAAVSLDARMGEAYFALYGADAQGLPLARIEDCLVDPAVFEIASETDFFGIGPGWAAHPGFLERHAARMTGQAFDLMPAAEDLLTIARSRFQAGRVVPAAQALPNYLREKVTQ